MESSWPAEFPKVRTSEGMKESRHSAQPVPAEAIARLADQGKNVSRFFKGEGRMVHPVRRVQVDFTAPMIRELDHFARELAISRQAAIRTLVRQALDQHNRPPVSEPVNPTRAESKGADEER